MSTALLDALEAALRAEREALSGDQTEALLRSTEAKLQALRATETAGFEAHDTARIHALAIYNRENGLLLARRRRAVAFALRQLGRGETTGYDVRGQRPHSPHSRPLAIA